MPARVDYVGRKFGRLTVMERLPDRIGPSGSRLAKFMCKCECDSASAYWYSSLKSGRQTECKDCASVAGKWGVSHHPLHETWSSMKRRCEDVSNKDYGGRGIAVCAGWSGSFLSFIADMGEKPSPSHSVDRTDNNLGYTCGHCSECKENGWGGNCRWATPREQCMNSRHVRLIEIGETTMCLNEWARLVGITSEAMRKRVDKCIASGDSLQNAIVPKRQFRRRCEAV